jgi:hypothetical protein
VQTGLRTVPSKTVPYYVGIGLCTDPMRPVPQDARLSLGPHWTEQTCAEFNAELVRHIFAHPAPVKVFASRVRRVQYQTCSSKAQYGNVLRAAKYYFHILPASVLILLSHDYHDY